MGFPRDVGDRTSADGAIAISRTPSAAWVTSPAAVLGRVVPAASEPLGQPARPYRMDMDNQAVSARRALFTRSRSWLSASSCFSPTISRFSPTISTFNPATSA